MVLCVAVRGLGMTISTTIRGVTAGPAVNEWAKARWHESDGAGGALPEDERVWVQEAQYPRESCYHGGDPQR